MGRHCPPWASKRGLVVVVVVGEGEKEEDASLQNIGALRTCLARFLVNIVAANP